MRTFFDQLDREVRVNGRPGRIISLVPSQTELLVDLGLEDSIVGVTKFCVHPPGLKERKKIVGGTKKVNSDKIGALSPDIILCNKEENTPEMVAELEKFAPIHVSDVVNLDDSIELIREYGEIFEVRDQAFKIAGDVIRKRDEFRDFIKTQPVKKVAYFIWKNPWMVVGGNTFIDHLLKMNNFENVFAAEKSRYPETDMLSLAKMKVDYVFLSTEPYPFEQEHKKEFEGVIKASHIHIVDGEYFSWYGSRLIGAFDYFKSLQSLLRSS